MVLECLTLNSSIGVMALAVNMHKAMDDMRFIEAAIFILIPEFDSKIFMYEDHEQITSI